MTYSHELLKATAQNKKIAKALVLQYDISMVVAAQSKNIGKNERRLSVCILNTVMIVHGPVVICIILLQKCTVKYSTT